MCGILGYTNKNNFNLNSDGEASQIILKKMTDSIAHRGPDAEKFFVDEHISLGFRRLAFIDAHGETSPLANADGSKIILFNGEIYNFKILKSELISLGYHFKTEGDAEVLLHGYSAWGKNLPPKLRGMFAFVIYDKDLNEIFLARDNFGIKPLYYYQSENVFMFASEAKAFLQHPDFVKEFDELLLPAYLSFSCVPGGEKSFFKNVFKIMPGTFAIYNLKNKTLKSEKYFEIDFNINNNKTFEQSVEEIKSVFSESVAAHIISDPDIKVGAFLSGGVDSAYTVSEIKKHINPTTYTISFEEEKYSEAADAKHTAELLKVPNKTAQINKEDYLEATKKAMYSMDEPLANPSAILLYLLSKEAAKDLKAVLSGEGADEMFAGYNVYQEPLALKNYQMLPLLLRKSAASLSKKLPNFYGKNFLIRGSQSIEERYVGNSNIFSTSEQNIFLKEKYQNESYAPQDYTKPIYQNLKNKMEDKYDALDDISKMQYLDIHMWMLHEILQKADKMSMAHSLELRVPFLDIEIWKIGRGLPLSHKVSKLNTKLAQRAAALFNLDGYSANMKKRAFPSPLSDWLKTDLYQTEMQKYFSGSTAEKYFQTSELLKILYEHKTGKRNNTRKIWTIYCFLIWYEQYFA